jgi:hypothetical protein
MADLGKFWSVLQRKMVVNLMAIVSILLPFWYILWPFGIFCGHFGIVFPL